MGKRRVNEWPQSYVLILFSEYLKDNREVEFSTTFYIAEIFFKLILLIGIHFKIVWFMRTGKCSKWKGDILYWSSSFLTYKPSMRHKDIMNIWKNSAFGKEEHPTTCRDPDEIFHSSIRPKWTMQFFCSSNSICKNWTEKKSMKKPCVKKPLYILHKIILYPVQNTSITLFFLF